MRAEPRHAVPLPPRVSPSTHFPPRNRRHSFVGEPCLHDHLVAQYHGLGYFGICGIALGVAYPMMKSDEEKRKVLEEK